MSMSEEDLKALTALNVAAEAIAEACLLNSMPVETVIVVLKALAERKLLVKIAAQMETNLQGSVDKFKSSWKDRMEKVQKERGGK